ncbi:hypothetical protein K505DRAFT_420277 [Melanomma pulvis-pyrius CBS 109.77]|uniref:Uncharacterized protein n=1 Tax=Melanomma pulvis-pyrius CBS 109.77 TaxID=1314802 RepID=A0A6A6X0M9_9PLEO|nr:hypothetical protein K505DRAFT_420277 [Melanomma pulvis-pyrius CBS 109.77]
MHPSNLVPLLASTAAAQSLVTVTLLNLNWYSLPALTIQRSDATATTYKYDCPAVITTTPYTTTQTQSLASDDPARSRQFCVPMTLIQGPQTWEFNATAIESGALTRKGECTWKGELTLANLTCTGMLEGTVYATSISATTVMNQKDLTGSSFWGLTTVVAMVTASSTVTTGLEVDASKSSAAPTGVSNEQSTGPAPSVTMPTGAMVFMGGVAGVLGLAIGL